MAREGEERTLEFTPTWAVATAASLFVVASLLMERGIHRLGNFLKRKNQKPLRQALEKMKEELMLLGFISLLLTVFQSSLSQLCIPKHVADSWLPCSLSEEAGAEPAGALESTVETEPSHSRKLLKYAGQIAQRKLLSSTGESVCTEKGMVPFVSSEGLHQLHLFIFVLAVVHVVYSCFTMLLGFAKMHLWKKWEVQMRVPNCDPLAALRETFLEPKPGTWTHTVVGQSSYIVWTRCFLGQFVGSVSKSDYLTFRLAFINNHHLPNTFDFHDYVIRSMEMDFRVVVGISWWLWAFVVLFLLLNVHDWYTYFWMAFIPLILVLVVGTKQQHIISILATEAREDALEARGGTSKKSSKPLTVRTRDDLFWFKYPELLLVLIHFILFQNAFELGVFFWLWATFGWNSCFFNKRELVIVRLIIGFLTQVLSSYSTLPLYALVTQMGTDYKPTIFKEHVHSALHGWHGKAMQNRKAKVKQNEGSNETSMAPLVWAQEMHQVNPADNQPGTRLEEVRLEQQRPAPEEPPPVTVESSEEETAAQKAMKEKLVRLYGKLGNRNSMAGPGPPTAL